MTANLTSTVQAMSVSDNGVAWGGSAATTAPVAPTGLRVAPSAFVVR